MKATLFKLRSKQIKKGNDYIILFLSATAIQMFVVGKQLKIEGFLVNRFADRTLEGITHNLQWVKEGKLKYREHVYEGFESAVEAFKGLFTGENTGKSLVKV